MVLTDQVFSYKFFAINGSIINMSSLFFTHIVSLRPYLIFEFAFVGEKLVRKNNSYLKYALRIRAKIIRYVEG